MLACRNERRTTLLGAVTCSDYFPCACARSHVTVAMLSVVAFQPRTLSSLVPGSAPGWTRGMVDHRVHQGLALGAFRVTANVRAAWLAKP